MHVHICAHIIIFGFQKEFAFSSLMHVTALISISKITGRDKPIKIIHRVHASHWHTLAYWSLISYDCIIPDFWGWINNSICYLYLKTGADIRTLVNNYIPWFMAMYYHALHATKAWLIYVIKQVIVCHLEPNMTGLRDCSEIHVPVTTGCVSSVYIVKVSGPCTHAALNHRFKLQKNCTNKIRTPLPLYT